MRFVLALGVSALAVLQAGATAAQASPLYYCDTWHAYYPGVQTCPVPWRAVNPAALAPQPTPPAIPPPATARPSATGIPVVGDNLDGWCKTVTLPSSIAICSDGELRALATERQRAYDDARARLNPEQQKALLADQNGWVKTYPQACGLGDDPPRLPLAAMVENCMAEAGRARIAYLRTYAGQAPARTAAPLRFDYGNIRTCEAINPDTKDFCDSAGNYDFAAAEWAKTVKKQAAAMREKQIAADETREAIRIADATREATRTAEERQAEIAEVQRIQQEAAMWLLLLLLLALYLLPSIVAFARGHQSKLAIALLNIVFGWTVLGWFGSLIWSLSGVWARAAHPAS